MALTLQSRLKLELILEKKLLEPFKSYWMLFSTVLSVLAIGTLRRCFRWLTSKPSDSVVDNRPLLAFGGAATLWPYYTGVYYYLYHHFDLTNVRASGISMGTQSAYACALQLKPSEKFLISLTWASFIWSRKLLCFFLSADDWVSSGIEIAKSFGVTDERIKSFVDTGTVSVGVTDISVFPPQHVILDNSLSARESLYVSTLSMRIFPFFTFPGVYRRMVLIDGVFTKVAFLIFGYIYIKMCMYSYLVILLEHISLNS
jgi:hypothetical protein